jgi:hypothetical protein
MSYPQRLRRNLVHGFKFEAICPHCRTINRYWQKDDGKKMKCYCGKTFIPHGDPIVLPTIEEVLGIE